ncbi:condensation domain-containing protein [Vibrio sp. PP-XX7]
METLLEAEHTYQNSSGALRDRDYWLDLMKQQYHPVCLSSGQSIPCSDVVTDQRSIPLDTYARLNALAEMNGSNFATLITALTAIYLYRMTGEMSLMVGFVHSGRMSRALRRTIGMTANVLPLGIQVNPEMSLTELLGQVKTNITRTARHSRYYSEELRQTLGQSGESALWFRTSINYVPSQYEVKFGDIAASVENTAIGPVDDFAFTFYDRGPSLGLTLYLNANAALYEQKEVSRHLHRLCHFLTEVATADVTCPCQIEVISAEERAQVLSAGQGAMMDLPEHQGIHQFVEQQALYQPNDIAVVFEDQSLTYTVLNQQANQLAYGLMAKGWVPEAGWRLLWNAVAPWWWRC